MAKAIHLSVQTPEEMIRLGALIGRQLFDGSVVGLIGPLGAGKTTLARGIAEGMGICEGYVVSSPTYTIMQVYPCQDAELSHLDLYRISGTEDLDSTGFRDAAGKGRAGEGEPHRTDHSQQRQGPGDQPRSFVGPAR